MVGPLTKRARGPSFEGGRTKKRRAGCKLTPQRRRSRKSKLLGWRSALGQGAGLPTRVMTRGRSGLPLRVCSRLASLRPHSFFPRLGPSGKNYARNCAPRSDPSEAKWAPFGTRSGTIVLRWHGLRRSSTNGCHGTIEICRSVRPANCKVESTAYLLHGGSEPLLDAIQASLDVENFLCHPVTRHADDALARSPGCRRCAPALRRFVPRSFLSSRLSPLWHSAARNFRSRPQEMGDRAQAAWQGEGARVASGRSVARPAESAARRNGILGDSPEKACRIEAPCTRIRPDPAVSTLPTCAAGFQ